MTKYPCDADNPYRHLQSSDDYRLGDTPNQLNTKQANWADVLVVDGLVYDKERIRELVAQIGRMQTFIRLSAKKWEGVQELEPTFVVLLRVANQQLEEALREIEAEAGRNGYLQGYQDAMMTKFDGFGKELADEYAAKVRQGGE